MSRRQLAGRLAGLGRTFSASPLGSAAENAARQGESTPALKEYTGPTTQPDIPVRILMGPGPANPHPRVLTAQAQPLLGHMHPPYFKIMDEIQQGLQYAFQTDSKYTLLMSGSGHSGMEALIANLLEPGDKIVVGNHGIWGERVLDIAQRYGADAKDLKVSAPGKTFSLEEIEAALKEHKPAAIFFCQGDSSTGTHQSFAGVGDLCRKYNTLLLVDTVCSLGGVPFYADDWKVDAMYSGSQKVLGGPPGAAPLYFNERAVEKLKSRKTKVRSYYLDLNEVGGYWNWFGGKRPYHHTGLVTISYAMRESLQMLAEEGLENAWARHLRHHKELWRGLSEFGLEPFVEKENDRLITVNTIKVPQGVDDQKLLAHAMDRFNLEISGGLGPTAGKVWRVGLLGFNANNANVNLVIEAFRSGLKEQGKL